MTNREITLAAMQKAAAQIKAENDNFLRAIAMVSANGRAQIIPTDNSILGPEKVVICLPRKQYDRLLQIVVDMETEADNG
jgi:hypothetical protein